MGDFNFRELFLGLLVVGILLLIISPGIRAHFTAIFTIADKYSAPKLELKNNYMFTAEAVSIVDNFDSKCTITEWDKTHSIGVVWECEKSMPEEFAMVLKNDGYAMRTFHGGTVVCKLGDKDCCGNSKALSSSSSEDCTLIPGELKGCLAGTYTFDGAYKEYEVHPVADCIMDSTYGCYVAGMTSSVKSCNPDKYIIVKMKQ